jgi:hypothetical protein
MMEKSAWCGEEEEACEFLLSAFHDWPNSAEDKNCCFFTDPIQNMIMVLSLSWEMRSTESPETPTLQQ